MTAEAIWITALILGYVAPVPLIIAYVGDEMDKVLMGALWSFSYPIIAAFVGIVTYELFYS